MTTKNHQQEVISRAYVQIIAGRCGLTWSLASLDYGIDLTIHDVVRIGGGYCESGFKIDIQLKSSTAVNSTLTEIRYDLDIAAYQALRLPNPGTPRILVLMVLPEDEREWTAQSTECLQLRGCAYWLSLAGFSVTKNKRAVRISIPKANVFSVEQLATLMGRVKRRELR